MYQKQRIIVWDCDEERIFSTRTNLLQAMQTLGCHYDIEVRAELPLLARMGVYTKMPVLEIDNNYWTWKVGEAISERAATLLLQTLAPHP